MHAYVAQNFKVACYTAVTKKVGCWMTRSDCALDALQGDCLVCLRSSYWLTFTDYYFLHMSCLFRD